MAKNETKWTPKPLDWSPNPGLGARVFVKAEAAGGTSRDVAQIGIERVAEADGYASLFAAAPDLAAAARKAIGFIAARLPAADAEAQGVRMVLVAALAKAEGK